MRTATKLWLGEHKLASEVGGALIDQLSGQLAKERDRRRLARLLDNFAEAVVDRIEPVLDVEFRSLVENESSLRSRPCVTLSTRRRSTMPTCSRPT